MYTAWSRTVNEWVNLKTKSHRFESEMLDTFPHGVPVGGFGAGTIGISPTGKWNCYHIEPGKHCYMENSKTGFSFKVNEVALDYNKSEYSALYPMAKWSFGDIDNVDVVFEQFSPVIMNDYQYTSYPVGCFVLKVKNDSKDNVKLEVSFCLEDILDRKYCKMTDDQNRMHFEFVKSNVTFDSDIREDGFILYKESIPKQMESIGMFVDGEQIDFRQEGSVVYADINKSVNVGEELIMKIVVCWDIPELYFSNGQILKRKYTEFFSKSNNRVEDISRDVLLNFDQLYEEIDIWHIKVFEKMQGYNDEIKTLMINETYYLAHGGTLWEAGTDNFGYLECIDYPFYETLDVRFYSSWALLAGWPELEKKVMRLFAETIAWEDNTVIEFHTGFLSHLAIMPDENIEKDDKVKGYRKRKGACPHDLGSFEENPFKMCNSYSYQNPNRWKDLNPKFILMVYRDYFHTNDKDFLNACYPAVKDAFEYYKQFDIDNDCLPENEGWPDQTYDNWTMKGTSVYCSLLWLAACQAYKVMSMVMGDVHEGLEEYIEQGYNSLEKKLWNGSFYHYDQYYNDIMADQLAGQWYLRFCNLPLIVGENRERKILKKVFESNYLNFAETRYGMVNGRTVDGGDVFNPQGNDVWLGVNFGIASYLKKIGLSDESDSLLSSLNNAIYNNGFAFRSPESFDAKGRFIAQLYMRPQAVWSLYFV